MKIILSFLPIVLFQAIVCERGICSWYGQEAAGAYTAYGEIFKPLLMTAAHNTLPHNTIVRVKCNGRSVKVRINDKGPHVPGRILDLSEGAAKRLRILKKGLCKCSVHMIQA